MTGRKVKEWAGKTPDLKVPASVRLRIFRNADGICHISGRKIAPGEPWHLEHIIPLHAGGRHAEDNLRPALVDPHKEKTKREMGAKAKADAIAKAAHGLKPAATQKIKSPGFRPSEKQVAREVGKVGKLGLPDRKIDVFGRPM